MLAQKGPTCALPSVDGVGIPQSTRQVRTLVVPSTSSISGVRVVTLDRMSSFLSNIFPWMGRGEEDFIPCGSPAAMSVLPAAANCNPRKRTRTPDLVHLKRGCGDVVDQRHGGDSEDVVCHHRRPIKFFRGETRAIPVEPPPALQKLPDDLLLKCLSFVGSKEDRFAVQFTSTTFRRLTNHKEILREVDVDEILVEEDTPKSAAEKLYPFASAWNLKALYMYVVKSIESSIK